MRGKPSAPEQVTPAPGITPAGAGKTDKTSNFNSKSWDHPRRCGENGVFCLMLAKKRGSPPQVRGKRSVYIWPCSLPRITPAGAGKTLPPLLRSVSLWDHPRRCGENIFSSSCFLLVPGSPPQVRGKLVDITLLHYAARITPAGAGKTAIAISPQQTS